VDADSLKFSKVKKVRANEVAMAKKLIEGMTTKWDPDKYEDDYKTQLMGMIKEKIKHPNKKQPAAKAPQKPGNVIDLMSILKESLSHTKSDKGKSTKTRKTKAHHRKAA
jgi:DNA end-binding protein Ku